MSPSCNRSYNRGVTYHLLQRPAAHHLNVISTYVLKLDLAKSYPFTWASPMHAKESSISYEKINKNGTSYNFNNKGENTV